MKPLPTEHRWWVTCPVCREPTLGLWFRLRVLTGMRPRCAECLARLTRSWLYVLFAVLLEFLVVFEIFLLIAVAAYWEARMLLGVALVLTTVPALLLPLVADADDPITQRAVKRLQLN